jgi:hypothetical protein
MNKEFDQILDYLIAMCNLEFLIWQNLNEQLCFFEVIAGILYAEWTFE